MKSRVRYLILLLLLIPRASLSDDYESTHRWDHIGTTYAVQMFTYGFYKEAFKLERPAATVFSTLTTFALTFTYSYFTAMQTGQLQYRDLASNGIGQAAAVGTIFMFSF